MSYKSRLYPWSIVSLLPNMQRSVIARHRRRNDATEHVKALQRMSPSTTYEVIFDPVGEEASIFFDFDPAEQLPDGLSPSSAI